MRQLDELLTLLGLIDTDVDLVNLYLDLLYEGVLGAYEQRGGQAGSTPRGRCPRPQ